MTKRTKETKVKGKQSKAQDETQQVQDADAVKGAAIELAAQTVPEKKVKQSKAKKTKTEDTKPRPSMAEQLGTARTRYTKTKSASGGASMNNGDEVATLLANLKPDQVVALAERVLELGSGTLAKRYGHLNPGQQRMNAGNRIRAAFRSGTVTKEIIASAMNA